LASRTLEEAAMAGEVITVYAGQRPPEYWDASTLMGLSASGPSSSATPWKPEVIALLRERWTSDGRLVVFVPGPGSCARDDVAGELIDWYDRAIDVADVVMFWWPDDADPCLMSAGLATWNDSQRVVHATPSHAPQSRYLLRYAHGHGIPTAATLAGLVSTALDKIGSGARRNAGEREVPLSVWRTDSFQRWYSAQTSAGNTLLGARQVWTFSAGSRQRFLLYWALHVRMYVRAESRVKSNEVVISRPDVSVVALFQRGATIDETTIVLVREFRSPASTPDGFVRELPSGSGVAETGALEQAVRETEEETGLAIDLRRIRAFGSRQLAATMSAHHAHLFAAEITGDELARLRTAASTPHGSGDDAERTWTEITTFGELRHNRLVDWATLGMIAEVVLDNGALPPGWPGKAGPEAAPPACA
jgi:ADP-ribose pyrophosphatase YjhB (NUDIX family)